MALRVATHGQKREINKSLRDHQP